MTNRLNVTFDWEHYFQEEQVHIAARHLEDYSYPIDARLVWEIPKKGNTPRLIYSDHHIEQLYFNFADYWSCFTKSRAPRGPLYKAISRACGKQRKVIDATVGTGKDSLLLLSWGFEVHGFERHPLIYLLLHDALRVAKLKEQKFVHRFFLYYGSYFEQEPLFDGATLYYDPMYPQHESGKKSALPRQEIQLFRSLIGPDDDIENNIKVALKLAEKLVLKRSLHSEAVTFNNRGPVVSYKGKNTRYDLYIS